MPRLPREFDPNHRWHQFAVELERRRCDELREAASQATRNAQPEPFIEFGLRWQDVSTHEYVIGVEAAQEADLSRVIHAYRAFLAHLAEGEFAALAQTASGRLRELERLAGVELHRASWRELKSSARQLEQLEGIIGQLPPSLLRLHLDTLNWPLLPGQQPTECSADWWRSRFPNLLAEGMTELEAVLQLFSDALERCYLPSPDLLGLKGAYDGLNDSGWLHQHSTWFVSPEVPVLVSWCDLLEFGEPPNTAFNSVGVVEGEALETLAAELDRHAQTWSFLAEFRREEVEQDQFAEPEDAEEKARELGFAGVAAADQEVRVALRRYAAECRQVAARGNVLIEWTDRSEWR